MRHPTTTSNSLHEIDHLAKVRACRCIWVTVFTCLSTEIPALQSLVVQSTKELPTSALIASASVPPLEYSDLCKRNMCSKNDPRPFIGFEPAFRSLFGDGCKYSLESVRHREALLIYVRTLVINESGLPTSKSTPHLSRKINEKIKCA
jgi:hypothetical protein